MFSNSTGVGINTDIHTNISTSLVHMHKQALIQKYIKGVAGLGFIYCQHHHSNKI